MTRALAAVARASKSRDHAAEGYRRAILNARRAGHSMGEIAKASGHSKQAIQQMLKRSPKEENDGS
jgi:IS30 family transposase